MELYHGSNTVFKKFKIAKELARNDWETILPEGLGIYMTSDREIAKSYGKIVYNIECGAIYDFSKAKQAKKIVQRFLLEMDDKEVLTKYINSQASGKSFEGVEDGDISVIGLITEIWDLHEERIYSSGYLFDLLDYQEDLEKNWQTFLKRKIIKYFQKDFKCNLYISKNVENIKIRGRG